MKQTILNHSQKPDPEPEQDPSFGELMSEFAQTLGYYLAIIVLLYIFIVRTVVVSGSSMYGTLADGDRILLLNRPLCGELKQGDIVVASMDRFIDGESIIKRIIATEGQTVDIDFTEGIVYVDGQALDEDYTFTPTNVSEGTQFPLVVEQGCVFLMGDNRNNSTDSRYYVIGQVDQREIVGKAVFLLFPGTGTEEYPMERDFSRIGGLSNG